MSRGEGELLTVPKPRAVSLLSVYLAVKPVGEKLWGGGGGRGIFIVPTNRWRFPRGPSQ